MTFLRLTYGSTREAPSMSPAPSTLAAIPMARLMATLRWALDASRKIAMNEKPLTFVQLEDEIGRLQDVNAELLAAAKHALAEGNKLGLIDVEFVWGPLQAVITKAEESA